MPYDAEGRAAGLVGGGGGIFGVSGTNLSSVFQPGVLNGSLTQFQLIGPNTGHPGQQLYNSSNKDFAPFVGFAWSLPDSGPRWLTGGGNKTVIRAGYGISYQRDSIYLAHMVTAFEPNALTTAPLEQSAGLLNVGNITLPITNTATPLSLAPIDGPRNQAVWAYNSGLRNPYIQNFSFQLQRALTDTLSLSFSYVGSSGNRLVRTYDINEVNVLNNGFLQAFQTVQQGGDSPLMNALLAPLGLNSTTMRSISTFQGFLANNNPGTLAALFNKIGRASCRERV